MHGAHGGQRAGAHKQEGGVRAEQRRVAQLEGGAQQRGGGGHLRVGEAELVEVVHVREAEDDGREEDGLGWRGLGEEEERRGGGAEEDFFGYGALDITGAG